MARRRRNRTEQRDPSPIANDPLEALLFDPITPTPVFDPSPVPYNDLVEIEDRRFFHPDPTVANTIIGPADIFEDYPAPSYRPSPKSVPLPTRVPRGVMSFRGPEHVAVCVRRQARREVLHALRKTGRGGSARRRYNNNSKVRC